MKNSFKALLISGLIIISLPTIAQNSAEIDSLLKLVNTMPDDTNKVILLNDLSRKIVGKKNNEAKKFALEAEKISKNINYDYGKALSKLNIGIALYIMNEYNNGLVYLEEANLLFKKLNDNFQQARCISAIGTMNLGKADYIKAAEYFLKALKYFEQTDSINDIIIQYNNLGIAFDELGNTDESLKYYKEGYEMLEKTNNTQLKGKFELNMGILYMNKKEYKVADDYFAKAYENFNKVEFTRGITYVLSNIGINYKRQKNFPKAIEVYYKCLNLAEAENDRYAICMNLNNIATIELEEYKNYDNAIELYKRCLKIAEEINSNDQIRRSLVNLSVTYREMKDYENAYKYSDLERQKLIEIFDTEKNDAILELNKKYETEKKEQQIIVLTKEKELQNAESKNKTYLIIVLGLIIFTAGIVVYYYLKNQKNKHRQKIIEERANEAENQKKRFAKELHDGTGSNLTGIRLQLLALKDKTGGNGEFSEIIKEIDRTHQSIRLLSYQAVPPEFDNYTLEQATHDLVRRLTKTGSINISYSSTVQINWTHTTKEFQLEIYRIIQEALSNVIKHSAAKNVDIQLIQHEKGFNLMIDDDGKGFDTETVNKGIGLNNISQRTKNIKGTLHIDTATGKGTSLSIDFPLPKIMKHAV